MVNYLFTKLVALIARSHYPQIKYMKPADNQPKLNKLSTLFFIAILTILLTTSTWWIYMKLKPQQADLRLGKSVDVTTPNVGENIIFTVLVKNDGPNDATGVIVSDLLPTGYSYVSDDSGGTYVSGTGVWTIGGIANGGLTTLDITAEVLSNGNYDNYVQVVTSDQIDPDSTPGDDVIGDDDDATQGITPQLETFSGYRALQDVEYQTSLGPRTIGSLSHHQTISYIEAELKHNGWNTEIQRMTLMENPIQNVIGSRGEGSPWIILGAHYDSRFIADRDPDPAKRALPVPGANDGASGVAVLLELSRVLPENLQKRITLVFFDAEDNGNIPGWDWILGSQAYAENLLSDSKDLPDYVIIVDMVGDADLNIYLEKNSNPELSSAIWNQAASLGYSDYFIPDAKHAILDDHIPFLRLGIPAIDIIDIDYPYYHTSEDTFDKVSAESLQVVGETLFAWLTQ